VQNCNYLANGYVFVSVLQIRDFLNDVFVTTNRNSTKLVHNKRVQWHWYNDVKAINEENQ